MGEIMSFTAVLARHGKTLGAVAFAVSASLGSSAQAGINETISDALKFGQKDAKYGQIKLNLRLRYENANTEETTLNTGEAFTARLRLGYLTPEFKSFQVFAEFEGNQDIGINDYNTLRNGTLRNKGHDVIADPQDTEVNQLWLSFKGIPDTVVKVGRQRIKIDNDRFIGNVGWRQLEQTYDSILVVNKSLPNTVAKFGFIEGVKRIFSDTHQHSSPFFNVAYDFKGVGKITGYAYFIENEDAAAASSQTFGGSLVGAQKVTEDVKFVYRGEFASQSDLDNNPNGYEVDYFHVNGGLSAFGVTIKGGVEQLGGEGSVATDLNRFQTPLATGHAFNGWADVFLNTPGFGLRDVYGMVVAKVYGVKLMGVYHDFTDDTGNMDLGQEYDFLVAKKFGKHYSLLAKYAYYNADGFATDRQKFWIQAGVSF